MARVKARKERGGAIIGLMIVLFLFLLTLGLFSFDASRLQMLERQLDSLAEAAALAGTSMMASYDTSGDSSPSYPKLTIAQNNGMNYAFNMVKAGNILGSQLGSSNCTNSTTWTAFTTPTLGQTNVFIQIIDPASNVPLAVPNPEGRAMRVSICYGYRPIFWPVLCGSGVMPIQVAAIGGLPQVDTVLVFDFSGSMDDLTVVTMVYRIWNNATNKMDYQIVPAYSGSTSVSGQPSTCLANYVGWNFTNAPAGSVANVLPPQNLDSLGAVPANFQPNCGYNLVFDYYTRRMSGANDYGTPPGNCLLVYPSYATVPDTNAGVHFTDVVVNIANPGAPPFTQPLSSPSPFTGFTINFSTWGTYTISDPTGSTQTFHYETDTTLQANYTFNFSNLGVLVEASRGNMESAANLNGAFGGASWVSGSATAGGTPPNTQSYTFPAVHAGYQKAYQQLAMIYSQPFATAIDGAFTGFYQKLEVMGDCRYGFIGFSDNTAYGTTSPWTGAHLKNANDTKYNNSGGGTTSLYFRAYAPGTDTGKYYFNDAATAGSPLRTSVIPRSALNATQSQLTSFAAATGLTTTGGTNTGWSYAIASGGTSGLFNAVPTGGTDCGEALQAAVASFNNTSVYQYNSTFTVGAVSYDRRAARRAVVFFTDGIPTDQSAGTAPTGNSLAAATTAHTEGICFYTIGLGLNPGLVTDQQKFLDGNTGLCATALNGSAYFPVNNTSQMKGTFSAVVRRLAPGSKKSMMTPDPINKTSDNAQGDDEERTSSGISAIEMISMVSIIFVVLAMTVNMCVMIFAADVCDRTCKDCARAAGQEPTSANALSAAQAVATAHPLDGVILSGPTTSTAARVEIISYNDYGGSPPAPNTGSPGPYVTVRTTLNAKIPAPIFFFGTQGFNQGHLQFQSLYTFPIVNTIGAVTPPALVSVVSPPPAPPPPPPSPSPGIASPASSTSTSTTIGVTSTSTASSTSTSAGSSTSSSTSTSATSSPAPAPASPSPSPSPSASASTSKASSPAPSPATSPSPAPSPVTSPAPASSTTTSPASSPSPSPSPAPAPPPTIGSGPGSGG